MRGFEESKVKRSDMAKITHHGSWVVSHRPDLLFLHQIEETEEHRLRDLTVDVGLNTTRDANKDLSIELFACRSSDLCRVQQMNLTKSEQCGDHDRLHSATCFFTASSPSGSALPEPGGHGFARRKPRGNDHCSASCVGAGPSTGCRGHMRQYTTRSLAAGH